MEWLGYWQKMVIGCNFENPLTQDSAAKQPILKINQ